MILKSLTLQNFKSFSNVDGKQTIGNLDKVNLIYGENNSGKSNILKFITLLFKEKLALSENYNVEGETLTKKGDKGSYWDGKISNDAYLFYNNDRSLVIQFDALILIQNDELSLLEQSEVLLQGFPTTQKYSTLRIIGSIKKLTNPYDAEISLDEVFLNKKLAFKKESPRPIYFPESSNDLLKGDGTVFENLMSILSGSVLFLDANRFIGTEVEKERSERLQPESFKNWLYHLHLNNLNYGYYEEFIAFVKKQKIEGFSGQVLREFDPTFSRSNGEVEVYLKNGLNRFPINSFGTGIQQILLILATVFKTDSKIILIEELELNLSPKTQQEVLQILANLIEDRTIDQVIFTSHSDILAKTPELKIYQVQMNADRTTEIEQMIKAKDVFFRRRIVMDKQLVSTLRTPGVPGAEWGEDD